MKYLVLREAGISSIREILSSTPSKDEMASKNNRELAKCGNPFNASAED